MRPASSGRRTCSCSPPASPPPASARRWRWGGGTGAAVTRGGSQDATGVERETDVLVLATGFATHGFVAPMEIAGRDGRTLAEEWGEGPRAYLGPGVPRFPNLFLLYGAQTQS